MQETAVAKALFLLKRAYIAVDKTMNMATSRYHLTAAQMEVLVAVAKSEGIEHRELLDWMGVSSPTLTNLVDKLVEQGLLERRISPDDARVKQLFLTDASREFWKDLFALCEQYMAFLVKDFTQGEIAILGELLERVAKNAAEANEIYLP